MEACGGAHHWGRQFREMGHDVRLIAPQFVKAYVKGNKIDRNDAAAICEVAQRPETRFVSLKTVEPQQVLALLRAELARQRARLDALDAEVNHLTSERSSVACNRRSSVGAPAPETVRDREKHDLQVEHERHVSYILEVVLVGFDQ